MRSPDGREVLIERGWLATVAFRAGDDPSVRAVMLARQAQAGPGSPARTRIHGDEDPTIALLDILTEVGDVLVLNQEQIASESYLGTATERRPAQGSAGAEATLAVYTGDPRRHPSGTLHEDVPRPPSYELDFGKEGSATLRLGDGVTGERLSTGAGQVQAVYRRGAGGMGAMAADQLSLVLTWSLLTASTQRPAGAASRRSHGPRRARTRSLRELLKVISDQVDVVEQSLEQLYDDLFIETAAEWVIESHTEPYGGVLLGPTQPQRGQQCESPVGEVRSCRPDPPPVR